MNDTEAIDAAEAQYRLLYSVVVAGKNAAFARGAMQRFMSGAGEQEPFAWVAHLESKRRLRAVMRSARMGCYTRLVRSFREIARGRPDLMTARPEELEQFHGVGPKTARFAIMWVRPKERYAALDTHVLKWLRFLGHDAPKATPSGEKYSRFEKLFLAEADRRGLAPRLLDAMIWEHASEFARVAGAGDPAWWPAWLQKEPAMPPDDVLTYFKSFAA